MNSTEFKKCPLSIIFKFNTLILTEKLRSHFFTVTETLNSDKYNPDVAATVGKTPPYRAVQNLKSSDAKNYSMYTLTMWYWILLDFKNILKFMWILLHFKRPPGTEF